MAIYVIDGYPGSGKTAFATKWIRYLLKKGETVFPNYKIYPENMGLKKYTHGKGKNKTHDIIEGNLQSEIDRTNPDLKVLYWKHFDDWQYMKNGTIICDESILYFNARNWEKLNDEIQLKLVQHRHEKLDLILTVQHYSRIDVLIRQMCEKFFNVKMIIGSTKFKKTILPRIARITEHYLEDRERLERIGKISEEEAKKIESTWFWIRPKVFSWYDTSEMVGGSKPMRLTRQATHYDVTCEVCGILKPGHSH